MKKFIFALFCTLMPVAAMAGDDFKGTELSLSETAEKQVEQDRVKAVLRYEATGRTTTYVQDKVNRAMNDAVKQAKTYSTIKASTGRYNVHQVWDSKKKQYEDWQATQTIILDTDNKADILKLVGALQKDGFMMDGLSYYLSREEEAKYKNELVQDALKLVNERADLITKSLNEKKFELKKISISDRTYSNQPVHRMAKMEMMTMSADSGAAPVVESAEERISVTVNAVVHIK